jgi:fructosamine-3-kinase
MPLAMISDSLIRQIEAALGSKARVLACQKVSGGDIHHSFVLSLQGCQQASVFAKINTAENANVLASEYQALNFFKLYDAVRYPEPYLFIECGTHCVLIMEYLDLSPITEACAPKLAEMLACQHQVASDYFGWLGDNFIGSTPQCNRQYSDWQSFYKENRLGYQFELAISNGLPASTASGVEKLISSIASLYASHQPEPVLLHGDLWSGNVAQDNGSPVLFDPAPYFGDREADIAMTRLFGGFAHKFHQVYEKLLPLDDGFECRVNALNLYHALNHFNMFGDSYLPLVDRLLQR